jgi:hypothetical protein
MKLMQESGFIFPSILSHTKPQFIFLCTIIPFSSMQKFCKKRKTGFAVALQSIVWLRFAVDPE